MMDAEQREAHEQRIRDRCDAGDTKGAATALLEAYGGEVLGFLVARLRDREAAAEVFSRFTEDLWKGMGAFRWECSARVWAYMLARHAASHHLRHERRYRGRHVSLARAGPLSALEERIRTATLTSARTEARSRAAKLRERLPIEDQTLLILRINRRLGWREIALVMAKDGVGATDDALDRHAAR